MRRCRGVEATTLILRRPAHFTSPALCRRTWLQDEEEGQRKRSTCTSTCPPPPPSPLPLHSLHTHKPARLANAGLRLPHSRARLDASARRCFIISWRARRLGPARSLLTPLSPCPSPPVGEGGPVVGLSSSTLSQRLIHGGAAIKKVQHLEALLRWRGHELHPARLLPAALSLCDPVATDTSSASSSDSGETCISATALP